MTKFNVGDRVRFPNQGTEHIVLQATSGNTIGIQMLRISAMPNDHITGENLVLASRAVYMTPERVKALKLAEEVLAAQTIHVLQRDYGVDHYTTAEDAHQELRAILAESAP